MTIEKRNKRNRAGDMTEDETIKELAAKEAAARAKANAARRAHVKARQAHLDALRAAGRDPINLLAPGSRAQTQRSPQERVDPRQRKVKKE